MKGLLVCLVAGLSTVGTVEGKKHCRDKCGKYWHNKSVEKDQSIVMSDCLSFLAYTIVPAPVTVTITTTQVAFENNPLNAQPAPTEPTTSTPVDATQTAEITVKPTATPDYADSHCKCDGCHWDGPPEKVSSRYHSVCKCAGATENHSYAAQPVSTSSDVVNALLTLFHSVTLTVTVPTEAATFKIRVNYENGTYTYLDPRPFDVQGGKWVSSTDMGLTNTTADNANAGAHFELGPNATLEMLSPRLAEWEQNAPTDADGQPILIWFHDPKLSDAKNTRPFTMSETVVNDRTMHIVTPWDGGKDYSEFMICESCGNQMFLTTGKYKKLYLADLDEDNPDIYDWVTLEAEPVL